MEEEQPILIKINSKKEEKLDRDEQVLANEQQNASIVALPPSASYHMMEDEHAASCVTTDDQLSHASKALVLINTTEQHEGATNASPACSNLSFTPGSLNREIVLAKLNQEKVLSLIRAWEDNIKAKSVNRLGKKLAKISAWEKAKKARAEAHLQELEEKLEKKKASFVENVKNEIAAVHRKAEEERALAEANHGAQTLKAEEVAAKYRASGKLPRKYAMCFGI
ncbi:hypothetical protein GOP47_0012717 [Adiantum capillus-veneris]|uniref:Remorin C-terminal domain-containing protein n=1 Tax=Adiantum capillus-veneris TaxID=13818 RepID=A0A9D4ZH31_ADICA|nr:hypothetical protein GOP47_0012717 [Adiantum capillus-veneris]